MSREECDKRGSCSKQIRRSPSDIRVGVGPGDGCPSRITEAPVFVHEEPADSWSIELCIERSVCHCSEENKHQRKTTPLLTSRTLCTIVSTTSSFLPAHTGNHCSTAPSGQGPRRQLVRPRKGEIHDAPDQRSHQPRQLVPRPNQTWLRLLARMFAPSLDRQLASGCAPESNRLLATRAQRLVSSSMRRALAHNWLDLMNVVRRPPVVRSPHTPICRPTASSPLKTTYGRCSKRSRPPSRPRTRRCDGQLAAPRWRGPPLQPTLRRGPGHRSTRGDRATRPQRLARWVDVTSRLPTSIAISTPQRTCETRRPIIKPETRKERSHETSRSRRPSSAQTPRMPRCARSAAPGR